MIFLSHNYLDKPVVEQIAVSLADIFGREGVFYDSWSIQPGEGIIDKMNSGLGETTLFFFFVSANSLKSKMVELEWQNALIAKTQSKLRFIPIRIDPSPLPPLLMQSVYLDLYTNGLDVIKRQIIDLAKGNDNFKPQHSNFSNIICSINSSKNILTLNFEAKHYLEPVCEFAICFKNSFDEFSYEVPNETFFLNGEHPNFDTPSGKRNILAIGKHQSLVPKFPFKVVVTAKDKHIIHIDGIHHKISPNEWMPIPLVSSPF